MKTSPIGLALIKRFEGFAATPYLCPAHIWTIGYGHVLLPAERTTLMQVDNAMAERLLIADVRFAERAVRNFIRVPLNQNQFDALVSFTFNVGAGALQRSALRRVMNRGEEGQIARQWMRWVWGGGRRLPGLARRRAAELTLFSSSPLLGGEGFKIVAELLVFQD
jgi:lysozyme